MLITRDKFYAACGILLGEDYMRKLLDAHYNPANFCDLIARKYFINDLESTNQNALEIVRIIAERLEKEGTHGLL